MVNTDINLQLLVAGVYRTATTQDVIGETTTVKASERVFASIAKQVLIHYWCFLSLAFSVTDTKELKFLTGIPKFG